MPFVPVVREIPPDEADRTPGLEAAISYWTGSIRPAGEWLEQLNESWGNAALAMQRGDEHLGFVLFGPRSFLPRAEEYPDAGSEGEAILLAYVSGDARARRHLLVRMFKELKSRGVGEVESIACDFQRPWHIPTRFLLENGWRPVRQVWKRGLPYTVVRTDLNNAVEVGNLARGLIDRVKLPVLKRPDPGPASGAFVQGVPAADRFKEAGSRS